MSLEFTHKPNYFLFAQLLIRHVETYVRKHPMPIMPSLIYATFMSFFAKTKLQPPPTLMAL